MRILPLILFSLILVIFLSNYLEVMQVVLFAVIIITAIFMAYKLKGKVNINFPLINRGTVIYYVVSGSNIVDFLDEINLKIGRHDVTYGILSSNISDNILIFFITKGDMELIENIMKNTSAEFSVNIRSIKKIKNFNQALEELTSDVEGNKNSSEISKKT